MKSLTLVLALVVAVLVVDLLPAQNYAPPEVQKPDDAKLKEIAKRLEELNERIGEMKRKDIRDPVLAEVEIYAKAADWIVRHNEFYHKDAASWTLAALDAGLFRANEALRGRQPWLGEVGHPVIRAYRSAVDGSVQPYAVTYPADYKEAKKRWRVDMVLHGRDSSISEVKFLHDHSGSKDAPKDQDFIQIDIFGRGNNAYRWAGEMDVLEAQDNFFLVERLLERDLRLDPGRLVLRGFSMGGAGTWHLGLQHPDRWSVIGPGAGFTSTHGYVKNLPDPMPPYQEACLRIADAVDYAENIFNVPVVAYAGTQDPQRQATVNVLDALKGFKLPEGQFTFLEGKDLPHKMPAEYMKQAEALYAKHLARERPEFPPHVHFVTYTLKYPSCEWVTVLHLDRHYEKTTVDAVRDDNGLTIKTANVRTLSLDLPKGTQQQPIAVTIDGQNLKARPYLDPVSATLHLYLQRRDGNWTAVLPERLLTDFARRLQKTNSMQGPIDDAFTYPFLCVIGTGTAWHPQTQKYAEENLKRFQAEWDKYLRGELPVKKDTEVKPEDLATKNLILFGDPSSNSLIAQVLDGLPLQWTKERITLDGKSYDAASHVPVLVYPSPLNLRRYIVLNSGHTFHAADFQGTNALLYPRLGDYAVLKLTAPEKDPLAVEVATAGLFDEFWQLGKK